MSNTYSYYPLTYPQKNIYQTEITYPGTSIGTIAATLRINDENLNFSYIEKALNLIIKSNDAMRCRIKIIDREPRQYFKEYEYINFDFYDYSDKPIEALFEYDKEQNKIPFEIIDSPLYYFSIIKVSDNECAIYSKVHHLINDAWAIVRVGNLVLDYYEKMTKSEEIDLSNVPSYVDYITDELKYLSGDRREVDRAFWASKLDDHPSDTALKHRKSKFTSLKSRRKTYLLPEKLSKQLRQYCKDTKTSLFAVILSAFAIYIKRTTHQNDMIIGTPVLNRSSRRQKNTLGMFISTVPLFFNLEDDDNFLDFNKKLTREWMSVLKHQRYPFEFVLKEAREKHKDVKDLFDIVFSYQNASFTENESSKKHRSRWHFNECQLESLSVHINDREGEGILVIDYDFLEELFFEKEIDYLHDNFIRVLWHALDNPQREMSKLEIISEEEKRKILYEFNYKKADYPSGQTFLDLFKKSVKANPNKTALIHENKELSYKELDEMSNSLANYLIKKGIEREDIVSIMIEKSFNMIVSMLSVLKAGGAYVTIEEDLPSERKSFILNDSGAKFFITKRPGIQTERFNGISIFTDYHDFSNNTEEISVKPAAENLAYVIYTSGTTGRPKGVMIEHRSLVNYVHAFLCEFKYDGNERVLEQSSYSFDAFVEEVYPTLTAGATIVIADKYGAKDMKRLSEIIKQHEVTVVSVSPLILNELNKINEFSSVKTYISGGDVLKHEYYTNLIGSAAVYNTYGPTEATVCATYHKCGDTVTDSIPIGSPIANYGVYILDANLNLVPIGTSGEIYISGPGLARGYLNRDELTAEMFIDNPYEKGQKMYRTKDVGRWYPMGEIDYIGRSDRQVKIRGVRIELGEIESELLKLEDIKAVVVAAKNVGSDKKKLCLYYVKTGQITASEIRNYLRAKLPSYMIPSYFMDIDKIPLSSSGKVNLEALPSVDMMILSEENDYVAPQNDVQRRLVKIVEELLRIPRAGIYDNYFELGGDSLDLTKLSFEITDEFNVEMPLEILFKAKDLKEIADNIALASPKQDTSAENNIFLMHKGEEGKNLFFIHDGIGGIGAYFELCKRLEDYNIWGIRSYIPTTLEPSNVTIDEMAERYCSQIMQLSDGPYNIAGWCIGGTIAFEVMKMLHELGKNTGRLFLIDTIGPRTWIDEKRFTFESEKEFILNNLNYDKKLIEKANSLTVNQLWKHVVDDIKSSSNKEETINSFISNIPDDIVNYFDDFDREYVEEMFSFINLIRTFHIARAFYYPAKKINSDICFIQADSGSVEKDYSVWEKYVEGEIIYKAVTGDHYSMLKTSGANEIAKIITEHSIVKES